MFVLPELAPLGYSEDSFARYLPNTKENLQILQDNSPKHGTSCSRVATLTFVMEPSACCRTIRRIRFDKWLSIHKERRLLHYDKMLLCDYGDCAETRYFTAGTELESFCHSRLYSGYTHLCRHAKSTLCQTTCFYSSCRRCDSTSSVFTRLFLLYLEILSNDTSRGE